MKITQIRNATLVIESQGRYILVDPMLATKGSLPRLKFFKSRLRNPLVDLPPSFVQVLNRIEYALITHCQKGHFDHLDRAGKHWLRTNNITTFCTHHDANYLTNKGIKVSALSKNDTFFNGRIEQVPATHTRGWLKPFMEHGVGYFITMPEQPSLYLMGDTVMTDVIKAFIKNNQPDYIVAPTGKAQFDLGAPVLLDETEIIELASISTGTIIANHMEALDHCRLNRQNLRQLLIKHGLLARFIIPDDGETIKLKLS